MAAPPSVTFHPAPRQTVSNLVFGMVWAGAMVVVLDVWLHLGGGIASPDLAGLFDATSEDGLGSWLSVTQTVLIALTLWGLAAVVRQSGASRARSAGWAALAVLFTYLAFDDGTRLHERVGSAFGASAASETGLGGAFPSYYWQLLFGPAFAAAGLFMAVFLWRELRQPRLRRLVAGALALLAVAVGLDFVDGLGAGHPLDVYGQLGTRPNIEAAAAAWFGMTGTDAVVHLSRAVEESVELVAMTLLWSVFLTHLGSVVGGVHLSWAPEQSVASPSSRMRTPRPDRAPVPTVHGTPARPAEVA